MSRHIRVAAIRVVPELLGLSPVVHTLDMHGQFTVTPFSQESDAWEYAYSTLAKGFITEKGN